MGTPHQEFLRTVKLGKKSPKLDKRTLQLARYMGPALPPPPPVVDWAAKVPAWGMMLNDQIGCCTIAAAGHMLQTWTAPFGHVFNLEDAAIVQAYSAVSGYDPSTGVNDNGAAVLDVLNYWRKVGIGGRRIHAFAATHSVRQSIHLFGSVYAGLALPLSARDQLVWEVRSLGRGGPGRRGSWGGHAVNLVGYDQQHVSFVSWGMVLKMTWDFLSAYVDELFAVMAPEWFDGKESTPHGLKVGELLADLRAVAG